MRAAFTLFLLAFSLYSFGQISITNDTLLKQGDAFYNINDNTYSLTAPASGANQTWNITMDTTSMDTFRVVAPSAIPFSSTFTGSNLASADVDVTVFAPQASQFTIDSASSFFKHNANGTFIDGVAIAPDPGGSNPSLVVDIAPDQLYFPSSLAYLDQFSDSSRIDVTTQISVPVFGAANAIVKSNIVQTWNCNGWGTLTVNGLSPESALLVEVSGQSIDSVRVESISIPGLVISETVDTVNLPTYYNFYTIVNGRPMERLVLASDTINLTQIVSATLTTNGLMLASSLAKDLNSVATTVFPNPSNGSIQLEAAKSGQWNVYDASAKLIDYYNTAANERVYARGFKPGVYFASFLSNKGELSSQRFIVK